MFFFINKKAPNVEASTASSASEQINFSANGNDSVLPLTFTAVEKNSSVTLSYSAGTIKYSKDGTSWNEYAKGTEVTLSNVGDYVMVIGTNVTTTESNHFSMTGKISASGDITSLTNGVGGDAELTDSCYRCMFKDCTSLVQAPNLPSTTMVENCYRIYLMLVHH